ncbi:Uncharacterised protein [Serratia fonticola]|uniref:Uncharacterized protein n=1 Tax=Serratia fonticola TaxID=47917 RepID=A0A4V6KRJ3_SERFO|nr:Uncharacterised protein [Serratia fonticola]
MVPPDKALPSAACPALPVSVLVTVVPSTEVVVWLFAIASAAAPAPDSANRVGRYVEALDLRSPDRHGTPLSSDNQPILPPFVLPLLLSLDFAGDGTVRTVPSENTKVMECTSPRTQDNTQSPVAVPETIAPSTSGSSMPLAVRFSLPISTLNGYGSVTLPSIGTRPSNAVMPRLPISVEFSGNVYTGVASSMAC